jgi:two-component system capsular synthesis response regulator RcsB
MTAPSTLPGRENYVPEHPPRIADEKSSTRYMLTNRPRHSIRIAVLDDHPIIAVGIASYLGGQADFEIIHAETSSTRMFNALRADVCDVAIVDFYMPLQGWDGVDYIRRVRRNYPGLTIICYSAGKIMDTEYATFRAGANAYLPKSERLPVLPDIIRMAVQAPKSFFSCRYGKVLTSRPVKPDERLTSAEVEILRHITLGLSVTQIARKLLRSKKTVSTHKRRSMRKLGLSDDLALALYLKERFGLPNLQ